MEITNLLIDIFISCKKYLFLSFSEQLIGMLEMIQIEEFPEVCEDLAAGEFENVSYNKTDLEV